MNVTKKKRTRTRRVPLDERVGYHLSIVTKRLNQALSATRSKKLGISVNNWRIMSVIGFFGPLSATTLGARTNLDPDKITRAVDTLVERGYVIRKADEADRRRVVLTLSAKGRRVHDKIELVASALELEFLSVLTAEEHRVLLSSLTKLERHSSEVLGAREGAYERRNLAGGAMRATKPRPKPGRRGGKAVPAQRRARGGR